MKAPDKTFPLSVVGDLLASTSPEEVVFMPDKIYFDGVDTSTTPRLAINEEYIRKDALLGKIDEIIATKPDTGGLAVEVAAQAISDIRKIIMSM